MSTKELQQKRIQAHAVRQWVEQDEGCFLVLSEDSVLVNMVRTAAYKHLALRAGCVRSFARTENMVSALKDTIKARKNPLLFVETDIEGQSTIDFIKFLKNNLPDIFILVVTPEAIREKLVLFIEEGANGHLIKPMSVDAMVERVAKLVKPASKITSFVRRGNRLMFLKQYEKALKIADKILEVKPDSAPALILKGDALKALDKREQAVSCYRKATETAGMYLDPLRRLAEYYGEEGDNVRELGYLDQLDEVSPWNVDRKLNIGTINVKLGNLERAEEVFDQAVKLTNREAKARVANVTRQIGELFAKRDPALAEKYLSRCLSYKRNSLSKSDVETFNALGMALRQQGKWSEAVANYQTALKLVPKEPNLRYNLALAYTEGGDHCKASEQMDLALRLKPELGEKSAQVSFNIAYVFAQCGQLQEAVPHVEHANRLAPDNAKTQALMKAIKVKLSDKQAAKAPQAAGPEKPSAKAKKASAPPPKPAAKPQYDMNLGG